ncbi:acyl-CoA dehydrogenase [Acrocarpospora pleiomorpha]|uniref:Acyl-CoA dehydrogenase n=1 Tax=Acrocarpospora pleiomorpha TaxID=90975 RepID=A0A5M3XQW1_9ACTN|nr:acyl-CoA dehydrogenase [Acrocarpospora pleiomorpha]GES21553.1 acyl-CoA dehydrogenase [Acrocarpospora pleiomorpha]
MFDPIDLAPEHQALRELVRRIADVHHRPLEEKVLRGERVQAGDLVPGQDAARAAGLAGIAVPAALGGAGMTALERAVATEEAARPLVPLRFPGSPFDQVFVTAPPEQRERFLFPLMRGEIEFCFAQTEPGGGSDPGRSIRTTAVRVDDTWVLNGNKVFISEVANADHVLVVAVTDRDLRQRGGFSLFIVDRDTPGLTIGRRIEMLGGFVTHEIFLDDCPVPRENVVGAEGSGFAGAQALLTSARLGVGASSLGIASRACEMMIEHARTREAFGSRLSDKQAVQTAIADSWIEIHQARLVLYNAASRADLGNDVRVESGVVKMLGTEVAGRVIDRAIQVLGAAGASLDHPLAHWNGLQRLARIYEGPTEVQRHQVLVPRLLR